MFKKNLANDRRFYLPILHACTSMSKNLINN